MEILFLTIDEVVDLHLDQIHRHGGEPSIRDQGLLESAVYTPAAMFGGGYLHEFPHGMTAAYLFHLVSNHPFVDGNKRTGLAAALLFLEVNGHQLRAGKEEVYSLVLSVASGKVEKSAV